MKNLDRFLPNNLSGVGTTVGYLFLGFFLFVIGLLFFFPEDALQQRLQHELAKRIPGKISIEKTSIVFPFSIEASNIIVRLNERNIPEIKLDLLKITPTLSSLIGQPGIIFDARVNKGHIKGSVTEAGALALEIDQYSFDEPIQGFSDLRLSGTISSARADAHLRSDPDKPSSINLQATGLSLEGTRSLGLASEQINLGQLNLVVDGKGRNYSIRNGVLSSGDILAEASGTILAGRTVTSTRLNLEINIKPAAGLDPSVSSLFELIGTPGRDGGRKLSVRGTLAFPKVQ